MLFRVLEAIGELFGASNTTIEICGFSGGKLTVAVRDFLEDEDYEDDGGFVPNFFEDDSVETGESSLQEDYYYGGGFYDATSEGSSKSFSNGDAPTDTDPADAYDVEEVEELFTGTEDFLDATSSYSIGVSVTIDRAADSLSKSSSIVDSPSNATSSEAASDGASRRTSGTRRDLTRRTTVKRDSLEGSEDSKVSARGQSGVEGAATELTSGGTTTGGKKTNSDVSVGSPLAKSKSTARRRDLSGVRVSSKPVGNQDATSKRTEPVKAGDTVSGLSEAVASEEAAAALVGDTVAEEPSFVPNFLAEDDDELLSSPVSRSKDESSLVVLNDAPVTTEGASSATESTGESGSAVPSAATASNRLSFRSFEGGASLAPGEAESLKSPLAESRERRLKRTVLAQKDSVVRRVPSELKLTERDASSSLAGVRTPSNGRLSEAELLFYANLGATKASDFGGKNKRELFLPPLLAEAEEERKARERRVHRALAGGSLARGSKQRLTFKDYTVLQFIAQFKFVSERQVGKLLQVSPHAAYKRLLALRKHGLVKSFKTLGVKGSVWVLSEVGMDLSGFELPRGSEASLTLSMVSHQFTVNHVASLLWSGSANVLQEKNFPLLHRVGASGEAVEGEQLVSELQIQSAFGKVRGTRPADVYAPEIKRHMSNVFDKWERAGGVEFGPSPELQRGNEYMLALFPPVSNRLSYHVPDLVVARPRGADGKPQSVAVEVELRTKSDEASYQRTLDAYRTDDRIFKKVVWVCRLKGTAEKLMRIAKRNGLHAQGRISIVPIFMDDGSRFTGRDTWTL